VTLARLRYKWDARVPMTQVEIARAVGCSRDTIRYIEKRALEKIRAVMVAKMESKR